MIIVDDDGVMHKVVPVSVLQDILDKLRAEIERQEKLLMIGCNAYNVNIALDTIKLVIDKYKSEI